MISAIPVQCFTNRAIKPTGSCTHCEFVIYPYTGIAEVMGSNPVQAIPCVKSSVSPIFYYQIVINMIRCNFLQSLEKFYGGGSEPP